MADRKQRTVAQILGEVTWLLTQSPVHRHLALSDLEWAVMPALLLNQFHVFYEEPNKRPVAVALWAYVDEETEKAILDSVAAKKPVKLSLKAWRCGNRLIVIEMICPFATPENRLDELLLAELENILLTHRANPPARSEGGVVTGLSHMDVKGMASA